MNARVRIRIAASLPWLATFGCGGPHAGETKHPVSGSIPSEGVYAIAQDIAPRGMSAEQAARWKKVRAMLMDAKTALSLGVAGDEGPETFGSIATATLAPDGDLYVLDELSQEVRVFDASKDFAGSLGGIGDGPTELRHAVDMSLLSDGALAVAMKDGRVKIFAESDDGWELDATIKAPFGLRDLCVAKQDRIFASGYKNDGNTLAHELTRDSGVASSFAKGYESEHWLVQMEMGKGAIGCASDPARVVFAYSALPLLRAFDPETGEEVWAARIEEFDPFAVYQGVDHRGRVYVRQGDEGSNILGTVQAAAPGYLLVQVGHVQRLTRTVAIRSYLVDAADGRGAYLGESLPRLAVVEGGYVALIEDPYPRLELRRFHAAPLAEARTVEEAGETGRKPRQ